MWFHKSRSVSKRLKRCNISFLNFGEKKCFITNTDVCLSNKETKIEFEKLFSNKGIDCDNVFNFKLLGTGLKANIFKLPLIDNKDNNSISIGLQDYCIENDILCIKKDNNHRYYLLLPYFKVNKDNLEEGKYVNKHTQMSYHLGLFEMQISIQETDGKSIKKLETLKLIDTISLKNESSFDEFFNNYDKFMFGEKLLNYSLTGLFDVRAYTLKLPLTKTIYFFDIADINNPKIGTIKFSGDYFNDIDIGNLCLNNGRWVLQFKGNDYKYLVIDNCNGKYKKVKMFKYKNYVEYNYLFRYNKFKSPYFDYWSKEDSDLEECDNLVFDRSKKLDHLDFAHLNGRYIRFQFTPFNNLNLVYYNKYQNEYFGTYLYEYSMVTIDKHRITALKLNSEKNTYEKYKINDKYKNKYHCYLYYLDDNKRPPYIQVWKARKTQQTYGCILNMMGKRGVFDKEIIEERK